MNGKSVVSVRRACTIGRLVAVAGLILGAVVMTSAASDPASLGAWTAAGVFATICLSFMLDRFLSSTLDRVDRFGGHGSVIARSGGAGGGQRREAA
ncbi:MAG: hypothetical protein KF787_09665 [Phycisphaeraceae bacterium]|nr:hypothetical protein [Phycisphaeraceae bacterium]